MNTIDFFRWLFGDLPLEHNIVVCYPSSAVIEGEMRNFYVQRNASTPEEATKLCNEFKTMGKDVFYGIGMFKDNITAKGTPTRKKQFVQFLPALIADIDCGDGKPYPDFQTGAEATHQAMEKIGISKAYYTLVCSGNGVHLYLKLEDILEAKTWEKLALKFKNALMPILEIDKSKTTDVALVLRPVGTFNFKKAKPRQVFVVHQATAVMPFDSLEEVLSKYDNNPELSNSYDLPVDSFITLKDLPHFPESALNDVFDKEIKRPKWQDIKCLQLLALEQDANVEEPLWYKALGVAAYCDNPREAAIAWSQNYDKYNEKQTIIKMNQRFRNATGATLCKSFEEHNDICNKCKYKDIIKTPISAVNDIGEKVLTIQVNEKVSQEFRLPKNYRVTKNDEIIKIVDDMEIPVSDYPIFITSVAKLKDLRKPQTIITLAIKLPSGIVSLELEAGSLLSSSNGDGYQVKLLQVGVAMTPKKMKLLGEYLIESYKFYQEEKADLQMNNVFGWTDEDEFIWGETIIKGEEFSTVIPANNTVRRLAINYSQKGDLNNWKLVMQIIAKEGMENIAFAVLAGLASPIYKFTNLNGITINFYSENSGTGKSTGCRVAQSIYGNPEGLQMEKSSTQAGIFARLGTIKNLPVLMDEISDADGARTSDLLYSIATGKERDRSDVNGDLKDSRTWSLIFMTTSNKSMYDKLDEHTVSSAGQKARLIEIEVPPSDIIDQYGEYINTTINNNYGLAGLPYLAYLVQAKKSGKLDGLLKQGAEEFNKRFSFKFDGNERFIKATIILSWIAGKFASKLGLLPDFNIDRIIQKALDNLLKNRQKIIHAVPEINHIIRDYLAERSKYIIQNHTYFYKDDSKDYRSYVPDEFKGRVDVSFKENEFANADGERVMSPTLVEVTIPVKAMRDYCRINKIPMSMLESNLLTMRDYRRGIMSIMGFGLKATETVTGAPLSAVTIDCYRFTLKVEQIDMLKADSNSVVLTKPFHENGDFNYDRRN